MKNWLRKAWNNLFEKPPCIITEWQYLYAFVRDGAIVLRPRSTFAVVLHVDALNQQVSIVVPELRVYGWGESREEALKDINDQIVHFYDRYANAPDSTLTSITQNLKQRYLELFEKVE